MPVKYPRYYPTLGVALAALFLAVWISPSGQGTLSSFFPSLFGNDVGMFTPAAGVDASASPTPSYTPPPPEVVNPSVAPMTVSITGTTATTISLAWSYTGDPGGTLRYRVTRTKAGSGSVSIVLQARTYTDINLTSATSYTYSVAALDASSNVLAQATTQTVTKAPKPTNLVGTPTASSVALTWSITGGAVCCRFDIYRNGAYISSVNGVANFTDTGLVSHREYAYSVTAVGQGGTPSDRSNEIKVTTLGPDVVKPFVTVTSRPTTPISGAYGLAAYSYDPAPGSNISWVQFYLNASTLGPSDTSAPYGYLFDTTLRTNGTYSLVAVARDGAGNYATSSTVSITILNVAPPVDLVPPVVSIVSGNLQNASGTVTISANASDNIGVTGVLFRQDCDVRCVAIGTEDTSNPYQASWNTVAAGNGVHLISAVARDAAGNRATSSLLVAVKNPLDPAKNPGQNFYLDRWNLQTMDQFSYPNYTNLDPTTATDPRWFFTDPADGSMVYRVNALHPTTTITTWWRTELREQMDGKTNNTNWYVSEGTSTLKATMKVVIPDPTNAPEQVLFTQIHDDSSQPPPVTLVWHHATIRSQDATNAGLWIHWKNGAVPDPNNILCGTVGYNYFDIELRVEQVTEVGGAVAPHMKVFLNNSPTPCFDKSLAFWHGANGETFENYFKAGNYSVQSFSGVSETHIKKLEIYHTLPGH